MDRLKRVLKSALAFANIPSVAKATLKWGIYGRAEARPLQSQNFSAASEACSLQKCGVESRYITRESEFASKEV